MKLLDRPVEISCQLGHRLGTDNLSSQRRHHAAHLPGADAPQKGFPDQQRHFLGPPLKAPQPRRQEVLPAGARDAQPDRPEAGHVIPLVETIAVIAVRIRAALVPAQSTVAVPLP